MVNNGTVFAQDSEASFLARACATEAKEVVGQTASVAFIAINNHAIVQDHASPWVYLATLKSFESARCKPAPQARVTWPSPGQRRLGIFGRLLAAVRTTPGGFPHFPSVRARSDQANKQGEAASLARLAVAK